MAALILLQGANASAQAGRVGAMSPADKPIALFNGQSLEGWKTWLVDVGGKDPRNVFSVTNGQIRISGNGLGYLSTIQAYHDYHLVLEYRWGTRNWAWGDRLGKARDSGLFLHSFGPEGNSEDGQGAFKAAIECNIFQGATGDLLLIRGRDEQGRLLAPRVTVSCAPERDGEGWFTWQRGGRRRTLSRWGRVNWSHKSHRWEDRTDFRGALDVASPAGHWTTLECICRGDSIKVLVNGVLVNHAEKVFPSRGQILLQCEGSEIFFRRVELLPLEGVAAGEEKSFSGPEEDAGGIGLPPCVKNLTR